MQTKASRTHAINPVTIPSKEEQRTKARIQRYASHEMLVRHVNAMQED